MRLRLAILGLLVLVLAGCGGRDDNRPSGADIPPPPIEKLLPPKYQADEVLKMNLTGGPVPETVVTSIGPPSGVGFHPATIQVLSWDGIAKRWTVLFDAQKVFARDTYGNPRNSNNGPGVHAFEGDPRSLLDPEADVTFDLVTSAPLLKGDRDQLVFSAVESFHGSGVPQTLVVADFEDAKARVLYDWYGEHLEASLSENRIVATSSYWTPADAHCCPSRDYRFTVGASGDEVTVLEDERPYLGVLVREQGESWPAEGPLDVVEVASESPAAGNLRPGDVLLDVKNAPAVDSPYGPEGKVPLYDKLSVFDAGQTARLVIRRDGVEKTVAVKLGSLKDAEPMLIPDEDERVNAI